MFKQHNQFWVHC